MLKQNGLDMFFWHKKSVLESICAKYFMNKRLEFYLRNK